jgi:hypothetical protein
MTDLNEADYRTMAEVCFEGQRRQWKLPWHDPEPRARLLRSAWYCVFNPDKRATARAAAADAGIPWGTVSAWISRDKRSGAHPKIGDVLDSVLKMPPAPGSISEVIAGDDGELPEWAEEILERVSGHDRVAAEIERIADGAEPDWGFLDELPATTVEWWREEFCEGADDFLDRMTNFARTYGRAKRGEIDMAELADV